MDIMDTDRNAFGIRESLWRRKDHLVSRLWSGGSTHSNHNNMFKL